MRLLGLPGRIPETFAPTQALVGLVARPGDEAQTQRYGFWRADHANPGLDAEVAAAAAFAPDLVIARSIGCLVAMDARARGAAPRAAVFIGAPVNRLMAEGRLALLAEQARACPTLFIQRAGDPTGAFDALAAALEGSGDLHELPGADHLYDDVHAIADVIRDWLDRRRPWA